MDHLEKRTQLIKLRIESLERRKIVLHSHEKWPTVKSVRRYQERKSSSILTEGQSPSSSAASQPNDQNTSKASPSRKSKNTKTPRPQLPSFPFPISRPKNTTSFPQFSILPPELRIQIWKLALHVPKFIETQFCTQFYEPAFVNCARDVVYSVCHESRAVALSSTPEIKSLQALTLRSTGPYHTRFLGQRPGSRGQKPCLNKTIHFNPEHDTIFFRSLNYPAEKLGSFMNRISGIDTIQHLAVPLEQQGLPSRYEWRSIVWSMKALKTLTFMVGSKEKSWQGSQRGIELRDAEQWYVDGRSREIVCGGSGGRIDVKDVGTLMTSPPYTELPGYLPGTRYQKRLVNVRIVAWKRGGPS